MPTVDYTYDECWGRLLWCDSVDETHQRNDSEQEEKTGEDTYIRLSLVDTHRQESHNAHASLK